jgi:hypothetical protein
MKSYKIVLDSLGVTCFYEEYETEVIPTFQYARDGGIHYFAGNRTITTKVSEGFASYKDILRWSEKENARVEIL